VSEDRSVERAVDRVDADATAALRAAAREAAHDAATDPVTRVPSGPGAGADAVREESAFADAFRIRLAIAARRPCRRSKRKSATPPQRCRSRRLTIRAPYRKRATAFESSRLQTERRHV